MDAAYFKYFIFHISQLEASYVGDLLYSKAFNPIEL